VPVTCPIRPWRTGAGGHSWVLSLVASPEITWSGLLPRSTPKQCVTHRRPCLVAAATYLGVGWEKAPIGDAGCSKGLPTRARRVVDLAPEEARMLYHDYIGTEHILLGLIHKAGRGRPDASDAERG
jgi:hypothetical protein